MKSLKRQIQEKYLKEKYLIDKDTDFNIDEPKIGKIARDYNGDEWTILDYCEIKDKSKLKKLIDKYDYSGNFNDFIEEISDLYHENDLPKYAVAAESEDSDIAIWIWGPDDLYYNE